MGPVRADTMVIAKNSTKEATTGSRQDTSKPTKT